MYRKIPFSKDNWITNIKLTRGYATGSSMGYSEVLQLYKHYESYGLYGHTYAKILAAIDVNKITNLGIAAGTAVDYKLKMYNCAHNDTMPSSYDVEMFPMVSQSWDEGYGTDPDHKDDGWCNWFSASSTSAWNTSGAFNEYSASLSASYHFDAGWEDVDCDFSELVSYWLSGNTNYGFIVKLNEAAENNENEYWRKSFYSRHAKDIVKRPCVTISYDDSKFDDRRNMYYDESGNIWMRRYVNGQLKDFNTSLVDNIYVKIQDVVSGTALYTQHFTSSYDTTGSYYISLNISSTGTYSGSTWHDVWYSGSTVFYSGTFVIKSAQTASGSIVNNMRATCPNLKDTYRYNDVARLRVIIEDVSTYRNKVLSSSYQSNPIFSQNAYWSIKEDFSNRDIIPFGTGSTKGTRMSYDSDGHYFDLYMDSLDKMYTYRLVVYLEHNGENRMIDEGWRFKII